VRALQPAPDAARQEGEPTAGGAAEGRVCRPDRPGVSRPSSRGCRLLLKAPFESGAAGARTPEAAAAVATLQGAWQGRDERCGGAARRGRRGVLPRGAAHPVASWEPREGRVGARRGCAPAAPAASAARRVLSAVVSFPISGAPTIGSLRRRVVWTQAAAWSPRTPRCARPT